MSLKTKFILGGCVLAAGLMIQACAQKAAPASVVQVANPNISADSLQAYSKYFGSETNATLKNPANPLNAASVSAEAYGSIITIQFTPSPMSYTSQSDSINLQLSQTTNSQAIDPNGISAWGACEDSGCNTYVALIQDNIPGYNPPPQVAVTLVRNPANMNGGYIYNLTEGSGTQLQAAPNPMGNVGGGFAY